MEATKLYGLLKTNEHKLEIIDRIQKIHPGYGTDLGWSWYRGGMGDDGGWNLEVLLDQPLGLLEKVLEKWEEAYRKVHEDFVTREKAYQEHIENGGTTESWIKEGLKKEQEMWEVLKKEQDAYLIWGDQLKIPLIDGT